MKYVRAAKTEDIGQVRAFYTEGKLDVKVRASEMQQKLLLTDDDGKLYGVMGYEMKGPHALLKECVISPQVAPLELYAYFQGAVGHLKEKKVEKVYIYSPHPHMQSLFLQLDFEAVKHEIRACTPGFWDTKLECSANGVWFVCG